MQLSSGWDALSEQWSSLFSCNGTMMAPCPAASCRSASMRWLLSSTPSPGLTPTSPWSQSACSTPSAAPHPSWSASRCGTWSGSWTSRWRRYFTWVGENIWMEPSVSLWPWVWAGSGTGGSGCALFPPRGWRSGLLACALLLAPGATAPHAPGCFWPPQDLHPWPWGLRELLLARLAVGIIPTLQKWRKAVWGQATQSAANMVPGGMPRGPWGPPAQVPPAHRDWSLSHHPRGLQTHRPDPKMGGWKPRCLSRAKPGCYLLSFRLW